MKEEIEVIYGSGNVWKDFGYPDADIRQAKSILAAKIIGILDDRKLSIRQASKQTGFAAADFSRVRNADLSRFTLDRLIRILHSLDEKLEVEISIQPRLEAHQPTQVHG